MYMQSRQHLERDLSIAGMYMQRHLTRTDLLRELALTGDVAASLQTLRDVVYRAAVTDHEARSDTWPLLILRRGTLAVRPRVTQHGGECAAVRGGSRTHNCSGEYVNMYTLSSWTVHSHEVELICIHNKSHNLHLILGLNCVLEVYTFPEVVYQPRYVFQNDDYVLAEVARTILMLYIGAHQAPAARVDALLKVWHVVPNTKSIIFNAKFIIVNANFSILNTQFTRTHRRYW